MQSDSSSDVLETRSRSAFLLFWIRKENCFGFVFAPFLETDCDGMIIV